MGKRIMSERIDSLVKQYNAFIKKHTRPTDKGVFLVDDAELEEFQRIGVELGSAYRSFSMTEQANHFLKKLFLGAPNFFIDYCENVAEDSASLSHSEKLDLEQLTGVAEKVVNRATSGPLKVADRTDIALAGIVFKHLKEGADYDADKVEETVWDRTLAAGDLAWDVAMGDKSALLKRIESMPMSPAYKADFMAKVESAEWEQIAQTPALRIAMGLDQFIGMADGYAFAFVEGIAKHCDAPELMEEIEKTQAKLSPLTTPQQRGEELKSLMDMAVEKYDEQKFRDSLVATASIADAVCRATYTSAMSELPRRTEAFGAYVDGKTNGKLGANDISFEYVVAVLNKNEYLGLLQKHVQARGQDKNLLAHLDGIAKRIYTGIGVAKPDLTSDTGVKQFGELLSKATLNPRQREVAFCATVNSPFFEEYKKVTKKVRERMNPEMTVDQLNEVKAQVLTEEGVSFEEKNIGEYFRQKYPFAFLNYANVGAQNFEPAQILGLSDERIAEMDRGGIYSPMPLEEQLDFDGRMRKFATGVRDTKYFAGGSFTEVGSVESYHIDGDSGNVVPLFQEYLAKEGIAVSEPEVEEIAGGAKKLTFRFNGNPDEEHAEVELRIGEQGQETTMTVSGYEPTDHYKRASGAAKDFIGIIDAARGK